MSDRPTHNPALGRLFAALRQAKGLSLRQAASLGRRRKVSGLGYAALSRLELGQVKHPSQDQVRGAAIIYEIDYDMLARDVSALVYGIPNRTFRDLAGQTPEASSKSKDDLEGTSHVSSNSEVRSTSEERTRNKKLTRELINLSSKLNEILTDLGDQQELERTRKPRTARRDRDRKVG